MQTLRHENGVLANGRLNARPVSAIDPFPSFGLARSLRSLPRYNGHSMRYAKYARVFAALRLIVHMRLLPPCTMPDDRRCHHDFCFAP